MNIQTYMDLYDGSGAFRSRRPIMFRFWSLVQPIFKRQGFSGDKNSNTSLRFIGTADPVAPKPQWCFPINHMVEVPTVTARGALATVASDDDA